MAQGDITIMNNFKEQMGLKQIDLDSDTIKCALYTVALNSPDGAATAYTTDNEVSAANYSAGGVTLANVAVTQDDTNNLAKIDADDAAWTALGAADIVEARIYDDTTTPKHVIALVEISTSSNGGNYTITWNASGIFTIA